jgi:hypothetical protein
MFKEKSRSYTKKSVLTSCMQTLESDIVKVEKNLYPTLIFSILKPKSAQFPKKKYETIHDFSSTECMMNDSRYKQLKLK